MLDALKSILLLSLLALFGGEALAMDCGDGDAHSTSQVTAAVFTASLPATEDRCSHRSCVRSGIQSTDAYSAHASSGDAHNCDAGCSCCPSHCASMIPATEVSTELHSRALSKTAYRPLDSSPAPESMIRPPIPA